MCAGEEKSYKRDSAPAYRGKEVDARWRKIASTPARNVIVRALYNTIYMFVCVYDKYVYV